MKVSIMKRYVCYVVVQKNKLAHIQKKMRDENILEMIGKSIRTKYVKK